MALPRARLHAPSSGEELRHYATKEDLANLRADLMGAITSATRWNIGVMMLVGGAAVAILRLT